MRIENFEKVKSLIGIAFKKALVEDCPLHCILVKHDIEDLDEVLFRAENYLRLKGIQKKKLLPSIATIFAILVRLQESRLVEVGGVKAK